MRRAHGVAGAVALVGLLGGWLSLRLLTGETGVGVRPYREVVGVAVATPAGLAVLSYLADVFEFDAYYGGAGAGRVALDVALSVVAAALVGLAGAAVGVQLGATPLGLFAGATTLTFVAAVVTFLLRTRRWQDWSDATESG